MLTRAIVTGSENFDQAFVRDNAPANSRSGVVVIDTNDLAQRVGRLLETEGYVLANNAGIVGLLQHGDSEIGLLSPDWAEAPRWFSRRGRRWWFGVLWLRNAARRAAGDHWVLEVHGTLHFAKLSITAEKIARAFGVDVTVRLVSSTDRERWLCEYFE